MRWFWELVLKVCGKEAGDLAGREMWSQTSAFSIHVKSVLMGDWPKAWDRKSGIYPEDGQEAQQVVWASCELANGCKGQVSQRAQLSCCKLEHLSSFPLFLFTSPSGSYVVDLKQTWKSFHSFLKDIIEIICRHLVLCWCISFVFRVQGCRERISRKLFQAKQQAFLVGGQITWSDLCKSWLNFQ